MAESYVIEPAGDFVMVVDKPRDTFIDGIAMPENVMQKEMVFGVIVFVGPKTVDERTKPEMQVCYGPYAGKNVVMEGIEFRLLREGQIEGYLRKKS
jgi:co-chaperonin GroES (HSP10)